MQTPKHNKNISISLHPPTSADLAPLSRLDIAANSTHPLIALSFPYPFQAPKLFLAHLQFCFDKPEEYKILVARARCGVSPAPSPESEGSDADSGVDVSLPISDEGGGEGDDGARGEIMGFLMWRESSSVRGKQGEEVEEWDWLSHLPKGADMRLWKRYTEVMSSDSEMEGDGVEILKLTVAPQYQRRGIGTKLLEAFLDEAKGREVRVRSSKDAKPLYEKFGWRSVREFKLDLREWGRCMTYVNFEMVRGA